MQNELQDLRDKPVEIATEYPADYETTKAELAELKEKFQQNMSDTEQKFIEFFALAQIFSTIEYENLESAVKNFGFKHKQELDHFIPQFTKLQMRLNNIFKTM